jgi:MFS family permease
MGIVGDRIGTRTAMMLCCGILCITLLALVFVHGLWLLYVIIPIYGFAHGGTYSSISPLVAGLFGTASQGAIYGVVIFGGTIGGAIGPLLAGYIFDRAGTYDLVFVILSAVALAGMLLVAALRPVPMKERKG